MSFSNQPWHRKCVEPVKRRHGLTTPQWQHHRFEIKGGISFRDAMTRDLAEPNVLFVRLDDQGITKVTFRGMPVRIVEAA